jgi:hypothetical protein
MPLDAAHVHLMLNHLPVIGAPLLLLLLTIGLLRGSRELVTVSLVLVVGLAVATGLVYLTGEPAEELVKHTPWFHDTLAERHEEHATVSLAAVLVTGLIAGAALALRHRPRAGVWLPRATWGGLALSTVLLGWTGWSGGQIRHEEVRAAAVARQSDPGEGAAREPRDQQHDPVTHTIGWQSTWRRPQLTPRPGTQHRSSRSVRRRPGGRGDCRRGAPRLRARRPPRRRAA